MFELSQIQLKSIKLKIYFNVKLYFDLFVSQSLKIAFFALFWNNELFILLHWVFWISARCGFVQKSENWRKKKNGHELAQDIW